MGFLDEKYLLTNQTAENIFRKIENLPVVDPHNHADLAEIAENSNYSDLWQLFAATDHYVWEVLRKRGVDEKYITGAASNEEKWLKMAEVFPEIAGNPVYEWIHLDLKRYLGIDTLIGPDTGGEIWKKGNAVLARKDKRPQQLLKEMNVELICSTDDPVDSLEEHDELNKLAEKTLVRPTWRPDRAMNIFKPDWKEYILHLGQKYKTDIKNVSDLLYVLQKSHDFFADKGCIASDHGLEFPLDGKAGEKDADSAFLKAMSGEKLSKKEIIDFMSFLLGEFGEMNSEKDWVFQLHSGAVRDIRDSLFENIGPDSGGDVSDHFIDVLTPLKKFLNRFNDRLKVVLYCLDPGHQSTMAAVSRAFGAKVNLGSAWWLNDNPIGMKRQLEYICTVDLFANFAGMVSDSRKLLSFGSRFEMFRRVLSDVLGTMVEKGQIPKETAFSLAERMSYSGPKEFFSL